MKNEIGIVGLGYVGLTLGLTLADLGFKVRAFDTNKTVLEALRKKKALFYEDGLEELMADQIGKNFSLVTDFEDKNKCDIYFVAVGTPLDNEMKPDDSSVKIAAENLGKSLKRGDAVVLRSTVAIGTTRNLVIPILEKESGLVAGVDFLVAFAPERTVEGKALEELRELPQIIGGIDHRSVEAASNIFSFVTKSVVVVDSLEAAEMIKLINNVYRDVTFGFANEISLIAKLWGIDTNKAIEAANFGYRRSNIPCPSPGVGGYCLEKDSHILFHSAQSRGYAPLMPIHARTVSETVVDSIRDDVVAFLNKNKRVPRDAKILALGLAYKGNPATSDMRGSTALKLLEKLRDMGFNNLYGFDPAIFEGEAKKHGIKHILDPEEGFRDADVVLVMNNNPTFKSLKIRNLLSKTRTPTHFFDGWALFNAEEISKVSGVNYKRL